MFTPNVSLSRSDAGLSAAMTKKTRLSTAELLLATAWMATLVGLSGVATAVTLAKGCRLQLFYQWRAMIDCS